MIRAFVLLLICALVACGPPAQRSVDRPEVLLATTTSFQDSGLLDVLSADFQKRTPYRLRATAVGTGAALAIGSGIETPVLREMPTNFLLYFAK